MGRTIRLKPVRHEAPVCQDYEDLDSVITFEREMRNHRAHSEPFEIASADGRADGTWQVRGSGAGSYWVDIVDGTGKWDACTCPDFLWNGLGT